MTVAALLAQLEQADPEFRVTITNDDGEPIEDDVGVEVTIDEDARLVVIG